MKSSWRVPAWWWLLPGLLAIAAVIEVAALELSKEGNRTAAPTEQTLLEEEQETDDMQASARTTQGDRKESDGVISSVQDDSWPKLAGDGVVFHVVTESGLGYEVGAQGNHTDDGVTPATQDNSLGHVAALGRKIVLLQDGSAWVRPDPFDDYATHVRVPVEDVVQINESWVPQVLDSQGNVYDEYGNQLPIPDRVVDLRMGTMTTQGGELYLRDELDGSGLTRVPGISDAAFGCAFDTEDALVVNYQGELYRWRNYGEEGNLQKEPVPTAAPVVQLSCVPYDDWTIFYAAVDAEGNGYRGRSKTDAGRDSDPAQMGLSPWETSLTRVEGIRGATAVAAGPSNVAFVQDGQMVICARQGDNQELDHCDPVLAPLN